MPELSADTLAAPLTRAATGASTAPDFVYSIYIGADQEAVWKALIDRDLTRRYWGHFNESDWKRGSEWRHVRCDPAGTVDLIGTVLEIDPPRRLVVTWAIPDDHENPARTSRVTFEIEPNGDESLLRVTHSELEADSKMDTDVREGWVAVLSNLKTLLETGKPLEILSRWADEQAKAQ